MSTNPYNPTAEISADRKPCTRCNGNGFDPPPEPKTTAGEVIGVLLIMLLAVASAYGIFQFLIDQGVLVKGSKTIVDWKLNW